MSRYWKTAVLQSLFVYLIALLPLPALAVEQSYNPETGVSGTPVEVPDAALPEKNDNQTVPQKKLKKSNENYIDDESIKSLAPDVKLSIPQVMSILRTTRNLSGKNLSGLNLVGLDMSRANLKGADLSKANLERADFTESNLERVNFKGANMKMASFFQSAITAADMKDAVLDHAIWTDKRICAEGSIGRCLGKNAAAKPDQPDQPAQQAQPAQQDQPEQPTQPQPPVVPLKPVQPPVPPAKPVEPPVPPLQPIPAQPAQTPEPIK